ncbi:MAG: hypothetical protein HQL56_09035 [Magnetococcales bacterium]|nr:hypothetical protein [Magnetococcales bacterium]
MKNLVRQVCRVGVVLLAVIPGALRVMAEDEEPSLPWWSLERYGIVGDFDPWTLMGDVGLRYTHEMEKALVPESHSQLFTQVRAGRGARGYILEPYYAKWKTDFLGGLTISQKMEHSTNGEGGDVNVAAQSLQSNADLRLFPTSRFPFNLYYNRSNSDTSEGAKSSQGTGRMSQKYGFIQQYQDREWGLNARFQAEERHDASGGAGKSGLLPMLIPSVVGNEDDKIRDHVTLRLEKRLGDHSLELVARRAKERGHSTVGRGNAFENSLVLTHSGSPTEDLSLNNMINVAYTRDRNRNLDTEITSLFREQDTMLTARIEQFTSNAFWRTADSPLVVTGSFRAYQEENDDTSTNTLYSNLSPSLLTALGISRPTSALLSRAGTSPSLNRLLGTGRDEEVTQVSSRSDTGTSLNRSLNTRAGASYRFDDHHNVNGSLAANQESRKITKADSASVSDVTSLNQVLGYQYDSGAIKTDHFDYSWYSNSNLSNDIIKGVSNTGGANPLQGGARFGERLGHGFRRAIGKGDQDEGMLNLSLDGSVGLESNRTLGNIFDVTHTLGFGYDMDEGEARSLFDVRLTDSRTLTPVQDETQLVNVQLSRQGIAGNSGSWGGNLSFSWVRNVAPSGELNTSQSASGSMRYSLPDLFGVSRLRYDMVTTIASDALTLGTMGPSAQEIAWRHLLNYQIGRINLRLGAELHYLRDEEGEENYLALITAEVVRNFYRRF